MKKLLTMLCFLPLSVLAQDIEPMDDAKATKNPKNELGLSTGVTLDITDEPFSTRPGERLSLAYIRNIERVQLGLAAEAGSDGSGYKYYSPNLVFNYRLPVSKSYAYIGMAAGYFYQQFISLGMSSDYGTHGYILGLQVGYVWNFSKHFSFTSELAVRSAQYWYENSYFVSTSPPYTLEPDGYFVRYPDKFFKLYLPVALGMRYRF